MHRITSATNFYDRAALRKLIHLCAALAIMFQFAQPWVWAAELRLDLTHEDSEPGEAGTGWASGVIPGITGGGLGGMKPLLPVKLSIRDISPRSVTPLDQITVDVVLQNVGKEPIALPCRSGHHWKAGTHGQRDISFRLELTVPGGKRVVLFLGRAYGAPDIPGSLVTLAPNDTLAIRAVASLRETGAWSGDVAGPADVKMAASVDEARWDDTRFEIVGTSRLDTATSPTPLRWFEAK